MTEQKFNEVRDIVEKSVSRAKANFIKNESYEFASKDISDNIPGYSIKNLELGCYHQEKFVSFFADMRNSTMRAEKIGPQNTFITIHAIMPAMIYVINQYYGNIVDLPGDGIMALFQDKKEFYNKYTGEYLATAAGISLLQVMDKVVNDILKKENIEPVKFGVGIDTGDVIVTKVGTDHIRDLKVIGNSVNNASKNACGNNTIFISDGVYNTLDSVFKSKFKNSYRDGDYKEVYKFIG